MKCAVLIKLTYLNLAHPQTLPSEMLLVKQRGSETKLNNWAVIMGACFNRTRKKNASSLNWIDLQPIRAM